MAGVASVTPCNKTPQLPWGLALASRGQPPAPRPPPATSTATSPAVHPGRLVATTTPSGSAIRTHPRPPLGQPRARMQRLQHRCPAGPSRPRKALPPSRPGEDSARTSNSPQKTNRGARGAWAGARQGYTPRSRDPKMEIALVHLHYRQVAMARGGGAGKGRLVSQRGPSLSPGCFTSDIKNLERLPGGGVMEGVALHLGRGGLKLAKSKPLALTGLQSVRAVSHLGVDT